MDTIQLIICDYTLPIGGRAYMMRDGVSSPPI